MTSSHRPTRFLLTTSLVIAALFLTSVACASAASRVSTDGYGKARFGMSYDEVDSAFGGRLKCVLGDASSCGCAVVRGQDSPAFLFGSDDELAIVEGASVTTRGIRLGDSTRKLKRTYRPLSRITSYCFGIGNAYVYRSGRDALLFGYQRRKVTFIAGQRSFTREFECG